MSCSFRNNNNGLSLRAYCRSGDITEVKRSLQTMTTAEICESDPKTGDTALHLATRYGHTEIVQLLLENGAMREVYNNKNKIPVQETQSAEMKALFDRSTSRFGIVDSQDVLEWMAKSTRAFKMFFAHSPQGINIPSNIVQLCFSAMSNALQEINTDDKFRFWHLLEEAQQKDDAIYFLKAYTVQSSFYHTVNESLAGRSIDDLIPVDDEESLGSVMSLCLQTISNNLKALQNQHAGRPVQPINDNVHWSVLFLQSIYRLLEAPHYKFTGRTYRGLRISKKELRRYTKGSFIYNKTLTSTSKL